ncbi:hypothetical protein [Paracraurococcus lichenis]|uniref:DNA-binding protein n=1 Tax=Paracraurococcus lichenis TaxID=3064888 RepID=A0ABT9E1X3_9PROT|nr:hypothetical protein [Paracraurococcus sp. LOR1-02]MDO9710167.1 hypothetical protein [Paracraurococcus sp. LOR1-02]
MAKPDRADLVTAAQMANEAGIEPRHFERKLRRAKLPWHVHDRSWTVRRGSPEHADLQRVLAEVLAARAAGVAS